MAIPDKSKLRGTDFATYNDDLPMPKKHKTKSVIVAEKPATKAPRKHFKEKQLDEYTCIDWVEYFIYKCNSHGYQYFRGQKGNIIYENKILSQLMKDFEPLQIKTMFDFVWDVWDNPKIDKRTMKITILNTGWMQEICNMSEAWSKGLSCSSIPKSTTPQREWRPSEPTVVVEDKIVKKKSTITV